MGFTNMHKAYLFGVGSLGGALLRDSGLSHFGLQIVGAFDVNPDLVGTKIMVFLFITLMILRNV